MLITTYETNYLFKEGCWTRPLARRLGQIKERYEARVTAEQNVWWRAVNLKRRLE